MKKLIDIKNYIQGWSRYYLFYSKEIFKIDLSFMIRKHIREQIEVRINSMKDICYLKGQCYICGCATTALQMSNKSCGGNCYPPMMGVKQWELMSKKRRVCLIDGILWGVHNKKFYTA